MLSFAPRRALPCDIGTAVYAKVRSNSDLSLKESRCQSVKAECDCLQDLRSQIELAGAEASIEVMVEYLTCLRSILLKLDLESFGFTWTNSIGCSRAPVQGVGLWFECLNILFNIAGRYMQRGASFANEANWESARDAFQRASGALFRARETELLRLAHCPPIELQHSTLAFLSSLASAQATECQFMLAAEPSEAWAAHVQYLRLADSAKGSEVLSVWHEKLEHKARHLGSLACLQASYALTGSRKKSEQALEYAALLRAAELAVDDSVRSRIQSAIDEPRGRLRKSLRDLTEPMDFNEHSYFSSFELLGPIALDVPAPQHVMLAGLLPLSIASSPLILSEKLKNYVEKELCSQLYNINRYTRSVMVKCNSPCSMELLHYPSAVPESLIGIATRVKKRGGLKLLREQLDLGNQEARHCNATIASMQSLYTDKDELLALQKYAVAGLSGLQLIQSKLESCGHLLEILERGEPYIARFLGISTLGSNPQRLLNRRTKPQFLEKAESFYANVFDRMWRRSEKSVEYEILAQDYDFFVPVMALVESSKQPKEWSLKDLTSCFDEAQAKFEPARKYLHAEKLQAEEDIQAHLRLQKDMRKCRKGLMAVDETKLKAAQSLLYAAMQFYDINYNLSESHRYYNALNTAVTNFKDRCENAALSIVTIEGTSLNDSKPNYTWRPGMTIDLV